MKFYCDRNGNPWSDVTNPSFKFIVALDENNWYIVRLSTWPILFLEKYGALSDVRDKFVEDGSWAEITLPEGVTYV